jgi:phospho-N-acetylmuramoyl-pentapeptide-transferase
MVEIVLDLLRYHFGMKIPYVLSYTSTRMLLAAMTALVISIFMGPRFIKKLYELKIGQTIRTDECPLLGELHSKKQNTPTMGGILIIFSMLVSMLLWMDLTHIFTLILFVTTVVLGGIGASDDYLKLKFKNTKGLSGKKKLIGQALVASLLALYLFVPAVHESFHLGSWYSSPVIKDNLQNVVPLQDYATRLYVPFFKDPLFQFSGIFLIISFLFVICVIAGSSNAANLTDGLDGLAAGCLILVATSLGIIAFLSNNVDISGYLNILYIEGSGEIAVYMSALVGACLGFLWYNGHPAQVFMGDTGSLALGGIIGVTAVLLKRELLLAIVGGIFVAEALSVIAQVASYRFRNKKRVLLCAPLHHHFEYMGWHEVKVVVRFWIIGLLLAIIGLASLKFQ